MLKIRRHIGISYTRTWWKSRAFGWRNGGVRRLVVWRQLWEGYAGESHSNAEKEG